MDRKSGKDKFTGLPDPFFYRIISLLPLDDFARAATLSKKFRNRCLFQTSLEISLSLSQEEEEKREKEKLNEENQRRQLAEEEIKGKDPPKCEYVPKLGKYCFTLFDPEEDEKPQPEEEEKKEKCPPPKENMYDNEEVRSFLISVLRMVMSLKIEDMNSFNVPWYRFKAGEVDHVNRWIQTAATRNIENLEWDLALEKGQLLEFPCCEVFKLKLYDGILKFLSIDGFSSLVFLTLGSVTIFCEDFGKVISSSKCLQTLSLKQCFGLEKIEIESLSLQEIEIKKTNSDELKHIKVSASGLKTITVAWYFQTTSAGKSFRLLAPGLQSFTWKGDTITNCNLGSFVSLHDACLHLRHHSMLPEYLSSSFEILSPSEAPLEKNLIRLIKSVSGVNSLELYCWLVEDLYLKDHLPFSFENVENLVVHTACLNDHQTPAIVSFLRGLPKLRTLKISCNKESINHPDSNSKCTHLFSNSQLSCEPGDQVSANKKKKPQPQDLKHLEEIEMEVKKQNESLDPVKLVEYLLEHAKSLKKMTVYYSDPVIEMLLSPGFPLCDSAPSGFGLSFQKKFG